MKSLRTRLTLWFTLGFVAVTVIHITFTYRRLDLELRKDTFERENKINPNWILHGSYTEEEVENIMGEMLRSSLVVSVPLMLLIIALGYYIARQSLRPIENLNRQLQSVNPGTLGRKVELPEGDEQFRSLLGHLNDMLARLERSFLEMSEYAAKVAHELRTPITILRHKVEQAQGKIDPDMAEDLQEELLRLNHVVEQSLLIAKAGQGRLVWRAEPVDLSALVTELVRDFELLATAQERRIQSRIEPDRVVETDAKYCKQILHALLTNALIHGRGDIHLRLIGRGPRVRFATVNEVRSTPTASELTLGLGLRVVRALVGQQPALRFRQHHGSRRHASCLSFPGAPEESAGRKAGRPAGENPVSSDLRASRPAGLLELVLTLAVYGTGRSHATAENHVDYKYELYTEEADRILVHTHSALFEQRLAPGVALKGSFVYDGISGATPTGGPPPAGSSQVPTAEIDDIRRAGYLEPRFKFGRHTLAPQVAYSEEEDYESLGLSLNYLVDFNQRNTTLNLGVAHNFDQVGGFYLGTDREEKDATDFLVGLTQVLMPTTLYNLTLTLGTASGYLSDPYKGFRFTGYPDPNALFPEKRPGHRAKQIVSTTLTQFVEPLNGSAELTYRFYHDSHELLGHTVTLEWFQSIGRHLTVAPLVRYYHQSDAYFYRLSFDADPSDPYAPSTAIPQFYSADYRLSTFRSLTYGISLTWKLGRQFLFDAAYKRYDMRGLDGATPQSSYAQANVYTAGLRFHF